LTDGLFIAACCQDRAFIYEVLKIGTDKTRRSTSDRTKVNGGFQWLALDVNFQIASRPFMSGRQV
jgi:hypothetical protein